MEACSQSKGNISYFHTAYKAFEPLQEIRDQGTHQKITFWFLKFMESPLDLNKTASSSRVSTYLQPLWLLRTSTLTELENKSIT